MNEEVKTPVSPEPVGQAPEKKKKKGCLKGCLTVFVVFLVVVLVGGVAVWRFVFNPSRGAIAKSLDETPIHHEATDAVYEALRVNPSAEGVLAVVLPLPDSRGNPSEEFGQIVIKDIDFSGSFTPASSEAGVRQQALDIVKSITTANREHNLDLRVSSYNFRDGDQPILSLAAPVDVQEAWVEGRISDEAFLEQVTVRVEDIGYLTGLVEDYLSGIIGRAFFDSLLDGFRR